MPTPTLTTCYRKHREMYIPQIPLDPAGPDPLNTAAQLMSRIRQKSVEMLALRAGQRVLDLDCGAGIDTIRLAHLVGRTGEVHGTDYDAAMVVQAKARAQANGVDAWVSHHHANATALPWPAGYFDASRIEGVFQHLLDPERAFDEQVRVTKPGGQLVVIDTDWATLTIDSDETDLERRLAQFHATHMLNNPFSGRHLRRMFANRGMPDCQIDVEPVFMTDVALARQFMGLDRIAAEAQAAGVIDAEESRRWESSLNRAAVTGGFFAATNAVMVTGQKPTRLSAANGRHEHEY